MTEWLKGNELEQRGTAAISAAPCGSAPIRRCSTRGSRVAGIYGATEISERHRHRYEVNTDYKDRLEQHGMRFSGMSPDGILPEIIEYAGPSLVHRRAVPSRAEIAAVRAAPAVRLLHRGGGGAEPAGVVAMPQWRAAALGPSDRAAGPLHGRAREGKFWIEMTADPTVTDRRRALRQRPAAGADRRPLRAGKPRACAGNGGRAQGDRRHASASASSTRPRSTRPTAPAAKSARGIGLDAALPIFAEIRDTLGIPVLTDVHDAEQCARVAPSGRRAADPGLPVPADRSADRRRQDRARPSTSRRASSWRPGT